MSSLENNKQPKKFIRLTNSQKGNCVKCNSTTDLFYKKVETNELYCVNCALENM